MKTDAIISVCEKHRYMLLRQWNENKPLVMFIGLNPSKADKQYNDRTITRCIKFAYEWGYGGMYFANLFSYRTPYVSKVPEKYNDVYKPLLSVLPEAYNAETDFWLKEMIKKSEKVICAWGSWDFIQNRRRDVLSFIDTRYCLGVNKDGEPKHPLYLLKTTKLIEYL